MTTNKTPLSEEELKQRALDYQVSKASEEEVFWQLLIFKLEGQLFACSVEELQETIRLQEVVRLPETHQAVSGLTNLRGSLLLTIDIRPLLGMPTQNKPAHILVVNSGSYLTGLLVENIKKVDTVPKSLFQTGMEIESGIPPTYIIGIGMYQDIPLLWLDIRKIVMKMESILEEY